MGKAIAADFGRLLGLAFVLSLALGLVLTAAAVAIPAPLACGESPLLRCEKPMDADPDAAVDAVPTSLPHGWALEPQWGGLPQTATPAPLHAAIAVIALPFTALPRASRMSRPAKRTVAGPGLC